MLLSKDWVYLDLEKTGCSFLRSKLLSIYGRKHFSSAGKHSELPFQVELPRILTIREPSSYYLSLWSYGLDRQGSFYRSICSFYPDLALKMYRAADVDSFSYFLDFALELPFRSPQSNSFLGLTKRSIRRRLLGNPRFGFFPLDWIPRSADVYTARILRLLVPRSSRISFAESLGANLSSSNLRVALRSFMPDILIRTQSLNEDFYCYANSGALDFMNLPLDWRFHFPLNSKKINQSGKQYDLSDSLYSDYHRSLLYAKSNLARLLLGMAEASIIDLNS